MEKHFVTFFSPGTFIAEETTREIESWDVKLAMAMARGISERHNATPYGFQFVTKGRRADELDSRIIRKSPLHYLGGEVLTLEQVKARQDPNDRVLISNMVGNGYERVIVNTNSWKWTMPLRPDDIVLQFDPKAVEEVV